MGHPHNRMKKGVWRQAKTGYILASYRLWAHYEVMIKPSNYMVV